LEIRKTAQATESLNVTATALSEREAATAIVLDLADVAPGARAAATEAGLDFIPFGTEAFDFALPRSIWFRRLFQDLLTRLQSGECRQMADLLGGYDFAECGKLIWGQD
jgi:molybdate-binding protein